MVFPTRGKHSDVEPEGYLQPSQTPTTMSLDMECQTQKRAGHYVPMLRHHVSSDQEPGELIRPLSPNPTSREESEWSRHRKGRAYAIGSIDGGSPADSEHDVNDMLWDREAEIVAQKLHESLRRNEEITKRNRTLEAQLRAARQELLEARSFIGAGDSISESEIVQAVHELNGEIYQAVKRAVEACRIGQGTTGDYAAVATEQGKRHLDPTIEDFLIEYPPQDDDRITLEIVLQAVIVDDVCQLIDSWGQYSHATMVNEMLDRAHRCMQESEPPSVAGRWRSLTHKYMLKASDKQQEQHERSERKLLEGAVAVFQLACVEPQFHQDEGLRESLGVIARAATKIRRMIKEDVLGSQYMVFIERPDAPFDPDMMEDEHATSSSRMRASNAGVSIVCPSRLGLSRFEKVELEHGWEANRLVKPYVVLETVVKELGLIGPQL
ncbi:uncharacterized protein C8Q71DRAFT_904849 [Rhodofomes roseus]|uniref:Uncharacterized protein n=1 Tax=Rhodofomes roseus TaxID=34475 RepID=A0ABQ8KQ84_9APHY|nr:uncharacterized protein C8Q71DRAFT_904849 [Rhodofomes roseus]KAH9840788.1 hypothetical protein C8Q71DRAFT_904849 [Rhodofomes roseus]